MADMNIKRELPIHPLSRVLEKRARPSVEEVNEEHVDYKNEPSTFSCQVCSASFVTRASLNRHMILHEDEEPQLPCCFCNITFTIKEELAMHISAEHGGAKFSCQYCNRNLSRRDHLKRHIRNVHLKHLTDPEEIKQIMKSTPMPKVIPGKPTTQYQFTHAEITPDPSQQSEEEYDDGDQIDEEFHIKTENEPDPDTDPEPYPDPESVLQMTVDVEPDFAETQDDSYSGMDNDNENNDHDMFYEENMEMPPSPEDYDPITKINASLNGIRVDRKYQCDICGASFMTRVNLQRHQTSHSLNRPHKCPICGKGFVRKEHLTKHLSSVHSGMKFTCEFCGKDISRKDHLIRHIRNVHPAEYLGIPPELAQAQLDLPISALQASGFAISDKALLSMQPKPKKPYLTCDMCDQTFTHINTLHEHQSTWHSDVRRFKCNFCPKAFKRKEHLTKHEVLHTGEKNFGCDHCGKEFPRKDALQDHIRRIHGTDHMTGIEYPCNFCEKVFLQRPNLLRHMKNMHGLIVNLPQSETGSRFPNNSFTQGSFSSSLDDSGEYDNVDPQNMLQNSSSTFSNELALSLVGLSRNPAIQIDRVNF